MAFLDSAEVASPVIGSVLFKVGRNLAKHKLQTAAAGGQRPRHAMPKATLADDENLV